MIADRSDDYSGLLTLRLLSHHRGHTPVVSFVKMADGFVKNQEIHRLTEGADDGDTLLLPYREAPSRLTGLVVNLQPQEHPAQVRL